jgi:hypothetical protein
MESQKTRELTIQPKHRSRVQGSKVVPELKLSGLWLEALGFTAGSRVVIEVRNEELIIRPA